MALALPARAVVVETVPGASEHPAASASFPASDLFRVPIAHAATDEAPGDTQGSSLFERLSAWFAGIFGRERTAQVATPSVIPDSEASEPANADSSATTTIIYQTVNQPVIERVVEVPVAAGVSEATLAERLATLAGTLNERIQNAFLGAARTAVVENVSDITVDGVSGLTDADIPDGITASNYLPLSGGTLTGSLTGTDLTLSGDLTVSGAQTLSGALEAPYVTATSTTEASSFAYRVGIGTTTPNTGTLEIFDESNGSQIATIRSGGSGAWRQTVYRNSTFGPQFLGNHGRGTYEAPETLLSGNHFLTISGRGWDGSAFREGALITLAAAGDISESNRGGTVAFSTVLEGNAGGVTTRMQIDGSGRAVVIATSTDAATSQFNLRSQRTAIASGNLIGGIDFQSDDTNLTAPGSVTASIQALANEAHTASALGTDLIFKSTNGTTYAELMRLTGGGDLGIGTTSPYAKLSVVGPVVAEYFHATSTAATSTFAGGITGSNNFVVQQTSGNVGIGTTDPWSKLSVSGGLAATASSTIGDGTQAGGLTISGGATTTATSTLSGLVVNSGNVGIGTANPGALFEISSESNPVLEINPGTSNTPDPTIRLTDTGGDSTGFHITYNNSGGAASLNLMQSGRLTLVANSNTGLAIRGSDGKVSIGDISAYQDFNVFGISYFNNDIGIGTTTPGARLHAISTAEQFRLGYDSTNYHNLTIASDGGASWGVAGTDADLNFDFSGATDGDFSVNADNLFVDTSSGNVGIGTNDPSDAKIVIKHSNGASGVLLSAQDAVPNGWFRFSDLGGPTNWFRPEFEMRSRGGSPGSTYAPIISTIENARDEAGSVAMAFNSRTTSAGAIDTANLFQWQNDGTAVMTIDADGNVGVATTSPWRKLSVTGTVGFDGLTGATGAGSLCLSSNLEVVYNDGADACLPSLRETKQDIEALSLEGLATVDALQPVSFAYKQGNDRQRFGFIAEDVADVAAPLATYDASLSLSGIDDRAILAVVIKALKELWAYVTERFASHDSEIERLKTRVSELESRLSIQPPASPVSLEPEPAPEPAPEETELTEEQEGLEPPTEEDDAEATSTPELSEVDSPSIIPDDDTDEREPRETSDAVDDEPLEEQPMDSEASANSASGSEQTDAERTAQEAEDANAPSSSSDAVDIDEPPEPSEPEADVAPSSEVQPSEQQLADG